MARRCVIVLDDSVEGEHSSSPISIPDSDEDTFEETIEGFTHMSLPSPSTPLLANPLDYITTPHGDYIAIGTAVELQDGDFLFVTKITRDQSTLSVELSGILIRRNRRINDWLPKTLNEVSAIFQVPLDENNPSIFRYTESRSLNDVVRARELVFTDVEAPSWRGSFSEYQDRTDFEQHARLVCRTKVIYRSIGTTAQPHSGDIIFLREDECKELGGKTVPDPEKWLRWRDPGEMLQHTADRRARMLRRQRLRHTQLHFADLFAGAGGVTAGAEAAGLDITLLVDKDEAACETLRRNFPSAKIYEMHIHDFIQQVHVGKADLLHVSFPCQFYSPAHTHPGRSDDMNTAAGYCIEQLLKKLRPRCVTFEQTLGLITLSHHRPAFNAFIHQIVACGYSCRWRLISCDAYGNAHARKRLFIIAACPGEPLPPFPKPTHGNARGLQQLVTIADRLALRPNHVEPHMGQFAIRRGPQYNPNRPLRLCITATGGADGEVHPSGQRGFDMQELALLAGFPPGHMFANTTMTNLRCQIGNAVPSMVMDKFFKSIAESMLRWNGTVEEYLATRGEPILIE